MESKTDSQLADVELDRLDELLAAYKASEGRELVRDSEDSLAATVARLADCWSIVRAPPVTIRRAEGAQRAVPVRQREEVQAVPR